MSSYSSAILADLPQAYYRLDESSGNVAYDATGNGYNALLSGSYTQSQPGAIAGDTDTSTFFSGTAGLQLPYTLNPTAWSAISLEFWTNVNGSWQYIVATNTGTTTLIYVNASVVTPSATALIEISSIFEWAGSYRTCNLDEIAIYNTVLTPTQISNHYTIASIPVATPGTPGGVRLLINDVYYPTIKSDTITIDRTANDPIPTFSFVLQDDPSRITFSELQEVVFIDAGQIANPAHNLLRNPIISPYATNWTQTTTSGGSFTQVIPGVTLTATNCVANFGLSQLTQNGLVVAGQSYMLSCSLKTTALASVNAFFQLAYLDASGAVLSVQILTIGTTVINTRYSLSLQAPTTAVTAQISIGMQPSSGTNSGAATFSNLQFEPMSFLTGNVQQSYPTAFCANGQTNCLLMPDGTTIRQYRLFGGYLTKATAGDYIGNNRQWKVTASGYAWLIQKQLLNDSFTNKSDSFILTTLVTKYFPNQFSTAQVATGATLDVFGYTFNGTLRDALDALSANSNFYYYIDAYRSIYYQPPGYNQLGFALSDQPDNVTSYPYDSYSLDIDGTQLGNATLITGGTNISAVEYDAQSIAYYNQKTNGQGIFWRTVNDSTIASTAAARQRAIAENSQYNYARQIVHLTTNQLMIPGYTVRFSSRTDELNQVPFLVQKATLTLIGFQSLQVPLYRCQCDLGVFNPDLVNITIKLLRKQLTNTNTIGTPVIGLMATEEMTFLDSVRITPVTAMPSNYGVGTYGTSTYAFAIPSVPTTAWGTATWGDATKGYN